MEKNLFLYDLAIVAILKNEGHYLKEWLDYHLLAGVSHFYIYDNESSDEQANVVKPYIKAGLVDYFSASGKVMQMIVYNDAVKRFKFQCRYMAFIDVDEFIYPKVEGARIIDVVDEILSRDPNAAGLTINWQCFGSNGLEKADYNRGVLERFTRRAPSDWAPDGKGNAHVKTIANPRAINSLSNPHFAFYFEEFHALNETGGIVYGAFNNPVTVEKIAINHYHCKSLEEYKIKRGRGRADTMQNTYDEKNFNAHDRNDEFDDGILHYRMECQKNFRLPNKSQAHKRLIDALEKNLSPIILSTMPPNFYIGKMETFLTCRAMSAYLRGRFPNDERFKVYEETSLNAILDSMLSMSFADARLLLSELPNLLTLPYPVVKDLRGACLSIIPQMMKAMHLNNMWREFNELDYLQRLLQTWN